TRRTLVDEGVTEASPTEGAPAQPSCNSRESQRTEFEFHMVYSMLDVPEDNLVTMHAHVDRDISLYESRTKADRFQRLAERMRTYFEPPDRMDEPRAQRGLTQLERAFSVASEAVTPAIDLLTQEGKISYLTYRLAIDRDYKPLFKELVRARERRTLFHVLGLLL